MPTIERQISQNGDDGYITCYASAAGYKSSETSFMVGRLDGYTPEKAAPPKQSN